jgi:hypothetical protein
MYISTFMFTTINTFNNTISSSSIKSILSNVNNKLTSNMNISMWYDPSFATVTSGFVTQWNDTLGIINLTQVANSQYITKVIYNGVPVILFSTQGASSLFNSTVKNKFNAIAFVCKVTQNNGGFSTLYQSANNATVRYVGTNSANLDSNDINNPDGFTYINGTAYQLGTRTVSSYNTIGKYVIQYVKFGSSYNNQDLSVYISGDLNRYFSGFVGDIIFFNANHTDKNRQDVEGILGYKYGLQSSLPTNHPYYNVSNSSEIYLTFG